MLKTSTASSAALTGICALYLLLCFLTFDLISEDAYIYFRFAANIANGYGYVFNQSGPPVEAGTSLIWQLLLVPLYLVDPEMVLSTKALGIFFGLLSLIMTHRVALCYVSHRALSLIPVLWLACSYPFFLWSHLGLETPLLFFLALGFLYCLINERTFRYWPLVGYLMVIVRPEGFMLCAALVPAMFNRAPLRIEARQVLLFLGLVLVVEVFRLSYFHDLVPHSFYSKIKSNNQYALMTLRSFLSHSLVIFPLTIGLASLLIPRNYNYKFAVLLIVTSVVLTWGAIGADSNLHDRSFAITLPFVYILAVCSLDFLFDALATISRRLLAPTTTLLAVFGLALLLLSTSVFNKGELKNPLLRIVNKNLKQPYSFSDQLKHVFTPRKHLDRGTIYWPFLYDNHQVMTGEFLALNYPAGTRVAYDQMGQTPWYAGLDKEFIDTFGLIDKPTGYAHFNEKLDNSAFLSLFHNMTSPVIKLFEGEDRRVWTREKAVDYVFDQEPDVIMIHALMARRDETISGMLKNDERLKKYYEFRYSVNLTRVYERKGIQWNRDKIQCPENCACRVPDKLGS